MNKEQKTIVHLYAAFVAGMLLSFVPNPALGLFGVVLLFAVLIGAYIYRARAEEDSLMANHMTYLTGTIWISSLILLVGTVVAGLWVYKTGDHSAIQNLMASIQQGVLYTESQLQAVFLDYMYENTRLLVTAGIACIGPGLIYLAYRTVKGLERAAKGYRIAHPKGWL